MRNAEYHEKNAEILKDVEHCKEKKMEKRREIWQKSRKEVSKARTMRKWRLKAKKDKITGKKENQSNVKRNVVKKVTGCILQHRRGCVRDDQKVNELSPY